MITENYVDVNGIYTEHFTLQSGIMEIVSVTVAAKELGLSNNRVRELIRAGKLPAQKLGREWAIIREDLEEFKNTERPTGRPPKKKPKQ